MGFRVKRSCALPVLLAGMMTIFAASALAEDKGGIVKWVDDKGVTHYGDSIPPEFAKHSNTLLNKSGRVLRQNEAFKSSANPTLDEAQQKQRAEQDHRDQVLLASYTTEQEIDLARERSTQMDESAIKGLEQRTAGVKERLAIHQKSAETYQSRKKPIPADLQKDIEDAKGELGRIQAQIAQKHKDIEETQVRFNRDKQRFHELKLGNTSQTVQPATKKNN